MKTPKTPHIYSILIKIEIRQHPLPISPYQSALIMLVKLYKKVNKIRSIISSQEILITLYILIQLL